MKIVIAGALLICVLTVLAGCTDWNDNSDGIKIIEQVKDWTETLGKKQITKYSDLCGERILEQEGDYYSGSYIAQTERMEGREVIFGGASVENRTVICSGNIETKSGSVAIRVRMNEEVIYLSPDEVVVLTCTNHFHVCALSVNNNTSFTVSSERTENCFTRSPTVDS